MIEQFRTQYTRDKAVEWYTAASFIYRLINKALRTEDIELLYLFRLYIVDLCWQLEQEHKKLPTTEVLTLYRGQEMPAEEFERLKQNTDILVSPNGFFSTSKDLNVALDFIAGGCDTDENRIVLFEITADPRLESVIFADIHTLSKMPEESEFLFSLGAVFVIKDVKYDPSINAWKVYMTAVDDGSKQKTEHFKLIQQQMDEGYKPTILFGDLLWRNMGEYDKAQKYFETILESLPHDHEDMPYVYYQLGCVFNQKDEWNVALDFFKKSYDLHCQHLPSDHPQLATSLRAIGLMYAYKQDYDQALHYYNQAFDFYKNYSSDHLDMAHVLMNIGIVFREKKQYDNALDYFTKALKIYQRLLPEHHYMIARWLDNTGRLYDDQLNFDRALDFYHQQYEMNEKIFPSEHIYLADDLNKIVNTYKKNGEYEKAINFSWMKFLQQKQDLPEMHIRKAHTLQTLGDLYSEKDISQAFVYYDEALMIFENCVPRDQPALVRCLERISDVYYNLSTYDEALKYRHKALNIQQNFRSSQHLNIGHTLQWLGKIYFNIKNYSQALDSLRRALQIYEVNYGSEHEKFKETRQYIDEIEATLRNDY
jgi:tetratricopeptide (TPR) repeat protein